MFLSEKIVPKMSFASSSAERALLCLSLPSAACAPSVVAEPSAPAEDVGREEEDMGGGGARWPGGMYFFLKMHSAVADQNVSLGIQEVGERE